MTTAGSHTAPPPRPARRPELDVLRVLLVIGLVFFHAALVFSPDDDFYVKNTQTSGVVTILAGFGVVWGMPMLFCIAGLGAWHSLHRRGAGGFAAERLRRLGVPLVVATLTIVPVPQWLRLRADPTYQESYLAFLPRFFAVHLEWAEFPFVVQGEVFETGHLWFVVLLLVFSLLLAPLVRWVPREHARRLCDRLATAVGHRGAVLLPAVPLAAVSALLGLEEGLAAWSRWAYLLFFCLGFVLAADDRFRAAMRRDAILAATLGLPLFLGFGRGLMVLGDTPGSDPFTDLTAVAAGIRALYGAAGWCWLVAILGLLDRRGPIPAGWAAPESRLRQLYRYLTPAVLPLYVLHQPILVGVAYGVVGAEAPIAVEYLVIVVVSLVATVAAYEVLVRRTRVTRWLLGLREPVSPGLPPARPAPPSVPRRSR